EGEHELSFRLRTYSRRNMSGPRFRTETKASSPVADSEEPLTSRSQSLAQEHLCVAVVLWHALGLDIPARFIQTNIGFAEAAGEQLCLACTAGALDRFQERTTDALALHVRSNREAPDQEQVAVSDSADGPDQTPTDPRYPTGVVVELGADLPERLRQRRHLDAAVDQRFRD